MRLERRWWVSIAVAVVAIGALVLSQTVFNRPSQECKPVLDLLAFNSEQTAAIAAKTGDAEGLPTVAEDAAYAAWADGLAERAGKVTSPELASQAVQLADLANQFVVLLPKARSQTESRAPGAPAPPAAYEMSALNARITSDLAQLSASCKN